MKDPFFLTSETPSSYFQVDCVNVVAALSAYDGESSVGSDFCVHSAGMNNIGTWK
jgi:hypothetical protein